MSTTQGTKPVEETQSVEVLLDAHNVSHAFCSQLKDIQWYCRRRVPGQYRLLQPWECYKAVLGMDGVSVAYLHLLCPEGTDLVIGKDEMRMQGISYWVRVKEATVKRIVVIQSRRSEEGRDQYEWKSLDEFETKQGTYKTGQTRTWPTEDGKQFSYSTRRPFAEGLTVQPTLNEATKVGETISTHTPDFRILQRNQEAPMQFMHPLRMPTTVVGPDGNLYQIPEMMQHIPQPTLPMRAEPVVEPVLVTPTPAVTPSKTFAQAVAANEE
jgi:hypothetical protein